MPYNITFRTTMSVGGAGVPDARTGIAITDARTIEVDQIKMADESLNLAYEGTLTTRTDANTGTITLGNGHGIQTGNLVDIYWIDANGDLQVHYDVTVGTVSGNSVPFDLGTGTNLPVATTTVRVCKYVETDLTMSIDTADFYAVGCALSKSGSFRLYEGSTLTLLRVFTEDIQGWMWNTNISSAADLGEVTNKIEKIRASTYATSGSPTMQFIAGQIT